VPLPLFRVRDGLRRKQRAPECLDAAYIRLCAPARTTMPISERASSTLLAGRHQSSPAKLVGGPSVQNHHICWFASREAAGIASGRVPIDVVERPRVVISGGHSCARKPAQLGIDPIETGRDHHVDIAADAAPPIDMAATKLG